MYILYLPRNILVYGVLRGQGDRKIDSCIYTWDCPHLWGHRIDICTYRYRWKDLCMYIYLVLTSSTGSLEASEIDKQIGYEQYKKKILFISKKNLKEAWNYKKAPGQVAGCEHLLLNHPRQLCIYQGLSLSTGSMEAMEIDRQIDRQIYIQIDRQIDRQIDKQIDRYIDRCISTWDCPRLRGPRRLRICWRRR